MIKSLIYLIGAAAGIYSVLRTVCIVEYTVSGVCAFNVGTCDAAEVNPPPEAWQSDGGTLGAATADLGAATAGTLGAAPFVTQ